MSSFYKYVKRLGKGKSYGEAMNFILQYAPNIGLNARLSIREYLEEEKGA